MNLILNMRLRCLHRKCREIESVRALIAIALYEMNESKGLS